MNLNKHFKRRRNTAVTIGMRKQDFGKTPPSRTGLWWLNRACHVFTMHFPLPRTRFRQPQSRERWQGNGRELVGRIIGLGQNAFTRLCMLGQFRHEGGSPRKSSGE